MDGVGPVWTAILEWFERHHTTAADLTRRVAAFKAKINQDAYAVADRPWAKDHLNPKEEKLRFSGDVV